MIDKSKIAEIGRQHDGERKQKQDSFRLTILSDCHKKYLDYWIGKRNIGWRNLKIELMTDFGCACEQRWLR